MSRFVTVATYDQLYLAEMTRESLEEAGVRVCLSDVEVVGNLRNLGAAGGGVKVQVAEENAERAVALLREIDFTREIDEEELAREALAAPTEDEWIAAHAVQDSGSAPESPSPASDRDKQASKALWWMVGGLFFAPAWAVGMYHLLSATFRSGPLSPDGRISLQVAGTLGAIMTLLLILAMTHVWQVL